MLAMTRILATLEADNFVIRRANQKDFKMTVTWSGVWQITNENGHTFCLTLDQSGLAIADQGINGKWSQIGDHIVISWDNGWTDAIGPDAKGFEKRAYAPGIALNEKPATKNRAEKVS